MVSSGNEGYGCGFLLSHSECLMFPSKPSSRRFSPTRLATTLTSSSPPLPTSTDTSSGPQEGFIILETNYRVYAYTGTPFFLRNAALLAPISLLIFHR